MMFLVTFRTKCLVWIGVKWDECLGPILFGILALFYAALSNLFKLSGTKASSFTSLPDETHICVSR